MSNPTTHPNPSERPTRLPVWGQWLIALVLLTSFFSGIAIWWGKTIQAEEMITVGWLRGTTILHGSLFPVQCVLFGVLLTHHIRVGWQMRANLIAGFALEFIFAVMILSGVAMYYAPADWHEPVVWTHRVAGLLMPVALGAHWIAAHFWIRRVASV